MTARNSSAFSCRQTPRLAAASWPLGTLPGQCLQGLGAPCLRPCSGHTVLLASCVFTSKPTKTQAGFPAAEGGPRENPARPGIQAETPDARRQAGRAVGSQTVSVPANRCPRTAVPTECVGTGRPGTCPQAGPPPREVTRASCHACLQCRPRETSFGDLVGGWPLSTPTPGRDGQWSHSWSTGGGHRVREPASKAAFGGSATSQQGSGITERRLRTHRGTVAMGTPALASSPPPWPGS